MVHPNFFTGSKTGIETTAVAITDTDLHCKRGIQIVADSSNSNSLYIGNDSSVTAGTAEATDGYPLAAGESIVLPVTDPNTVFVIGPAGTGKLFFVSV
jgi:hypothetical protein|tara:strand:+ start:132 stop:425 length:294 start_codon:yes stop_codon:yes gene_type:complete